MHTGPCCADQLPPMLPFAATSILAVATLVWWVWFHRAEFNSRRGVMGRPRLPRPRLEEVSAGRAHDRFATEFAIAGAPGSAAAGRPEGPDFWAVKDVSFSVAPGQRSASSAPAGPANRPRSLLPILKPTHGTAKSKGGWALIKAAGFHPVDRAGNIYLQGAIMGMRRVKSPQHLDGSSSLPASATSSIRRSRYSSGMNARLGFAHSTRTS